MYKFSINKELFEKILSKETKILEKENTNYWKKELLEPIIIDNKLTYQIKQFKKIFLSNGLGENKPQLVIECLKVDYSIENECFEIYLGKILEQKNTNQIKIEIEDEKDKIIQQLMKEKEELERKLKEI